MPTHKHALTNQQRKPPSPIEPETIILRNKLEQALLGELAPVIPEIVKWLRERIEGTHTTDKDDDPLVKMMMKVIDKIIPERRQIESNAPTGNFVAGAVLVLGGNGAVKRGTLEANQHAIDVTAQKRLRYAEGEGDAGNGTANSAN